MSRFKPFSLQPDSSNYYRAVPVWEEESEPREIRSSGPVGYGMSRQSDPAVAEAMALGHTVGYGMGKQMGPAAEMATGYGKDGPLGPVKERVQRGNIFQDLWNRLPLMVEENLRPGSKGYAKAEMKSGTLVPYTGRMWLSDEKKVKLKELAEGKKGEGRGGKGRGEAETSGAGDQSEGGAGGDEGGSENSELKALREALQKYSEQEGKLDLTPLLALTDSWTGSRMAQSYDRPMNDEEREQLVMGLRSKIAQHEDDIVYKRDYMKHQAALERYRLQEKAEENEKNRELRRLALGGRDGRDSDRHGQRDIRDRSRYMRENKKALLFIAKAQNPGGGEDDKSHEITIGPLNDEIFEAGRELEEQGGVPYGRGYSMALEEFIAYANELNSRKK
jgi:hypothetical protein